MDTSNFDMETALNSRHEAFAQGYASGATGADAARRAGYSPAGAASRASELLQRTDVAERLAQLSAEAASQSTQAANALLDKLEPLYEKGLENDDTDAVLQVVELQARILGLVHGGATIRPRGFGGTQEAVHTRLRHEDCLDLLD
ncbi:MAG: hypothetical protein HOA18_19150 [Rhodospirillaceae bacterium]|mgnify:FL=1|nr:hypothetical protein [Rhodospirillaceae bacterium]